MFGATTHSSSHGGGGGAKSPTSQQVPEHVPDLPVLLLTKQPLFPRFSRVVEVRIVQFVVDF